jgi:hypothetical protein
MKKLIGLLLVFTINVLGQKTVPLTLLFQQSLEDSKSVLLDSLYILDNKMSLKIETLKFYISHIQLLNKDKIVYTEDAKAHLIDVSDYKSQEITLSVPENLSCTKLKFNLGIDSLTNVSGAYGGDLDPTKAMYWTWQSGYINFKLEGSCSVCPPPKKEFQFHVGGYQSPYSTMREITLDVSHKNKINVVFDLKQFIEQLDLSKQNHLMSPNKEAVLFSKILAKSFRIN